MYAGSMFSFTLLFGLFGLFGFWDGGSSFSRESSQSSTGGELDSFVILWSFLDFSTLCLLEAAFLCKAITSNLYKRQNKLATKSSQGKKNAKRESLCPAQINSYIDVINIYILYILLKGTFLLPDFVLSASGVGLTPFFSPSMFSKSSKEASPSASNRIPFVGCFFFCRSLA